MVERPVASRPGLRWHARPPHDLGLYSQTFMINLVAALIPAPHQHDHELLLEYQARAPRSPTSLQVVLVDLLVEKL